MSIPKSPSLPRERFLLPYIAFFLLALIALQLLSFYGSKASEFSLWTRTWGFNHLLFLDKNYVILTFLVLGLILIPAVNDKIRQLLCFITQSISRPVVQNLVILVVSVLFGIIFYQVRVRYYLLGDFNLRVIQTMRKDYVNTEYLTMYGLHHLALFLSKFRIDADHTFKYFSCFCGSVFTFFSFHTAIQFSSNALQRSLSFLAIFCSSLLLLFCGYVEIYCAPATLLLIYIYAAARYLNNRAGLWLPLLALLLAIASHLLNASAAPSLIVAIYFRNKNSFPAIQKISNTTIALIVFILTILALMVVFASKSSFAMPLPKLGKRQDYLTFLSIKHLWEFLNGQILCSGLSLFLCLFLLIRSVSKKIELEGLHYFLLTISSCTILLVLVSNLQRGSGDWDIMSFPSISLNLLCVSLFFKVYAHRTAIASYSSIVLIFINLANAILWIGINHTDVSLKKFENMLSNDPASYYTARISGRLQIAIAYQNNKLFDDASRVALLACNDPYKGDIRACILYAKLLQNANRLDESRDFFEWLLQNKASAVLEAYLFLLEYYELRNNNEKIIYYLNRLFDEFEMQPDLFINNLNFKAPMLAGLFDVLYTIEKPKGDEQRLARIQVVKQKLERFPKTPAKK
jgi:hypothetical protein